MYPGNSTDAEPPETPIEQAIEQEQLKSTPKWRAEQEEAEASAVLADIGEYVAESDPASLPEAEAELRAWKIPVEPTHLTDAGDESGAPLCVVFSASSESEAHIVRGLLEAEGIAAMLREMDAPIYGSTIPSGSGRWGDVLVAQQQAEKAQQIIAESTDAESAGASD